MKREGKKMKRVIKLMVVCGVVAAMGLWLGGCVPTYSPIASHTLAAGADVETDVVWLIESDVRVVRCGNTAQGPVCIRAGIR